MKKMSEFLDLPVEPAFRETRDPYRKTPGDR